MKTAKGATRFSRIASGIVRATFFVALGAGSALAGGQPVTQMDIRATAVSVEGALSANDDPTAAIWNKVPEQAIELNLAPPFHQSIALLQAAGGPARATLPLNVSVITDRQRIYFRLRWKDKTKDDRRTIELFPDSVAIEVPLTGEETSPMMGTPDRPVSIWRWSAASNGVESLLAGGPGTLTPGKSEKPRGNGAYRSANDAAKREWMVVISQDLDAGGDGWTPLRARPSFPVAFAVWQGSERQRGGFKRVSNWISVRLESSK